MEYLQINTENIDVILELFNKSRDVEGFITNKKTGERIKCLYSKRVINIKDFSILPGSATFVNNDAYCFAQHRIRHPK